MKSKIEKVEVFGVGMPLVDTFTSGGISKNQTKCVVVRLTAANGATGVGSMEPSAAAKSPHTASDLLTAVENGVSKALIGRDVLNVNQIIDLLDNLAPDQPGARAVVEMASVDLACRILDVPMHTYLGGAVQTRVEFNAWVGMLPPAEAAAEAKRWFKAGFRTAKIKVGSGVNPDRDRIAAVRDAVGGAMQLRIDANCQYDAATSVELCRVIKQFDLQLFEQPVPKEDIEGMAHVRRAGGVPIMADESISDHESLLKVIRADAADYVKFGIEQAGGLLRAVKMIATAEAAGLPVVMGHGFGLDPSTMAEVMLAFACKGVLPGLECVGPLKVKDTIAKSRLDISSGSLSLPVASGLGMELDQSKLDAYKLR